MAKRDYDNDYPSVTQVLGVLRKIGLEMWFKYNSAKECDALSKAGREAGTDTHDAIQQYIETGKAKIESKYADEVSTALQSFILFRKENPEIELSLSEVALTHPNYQYNGTIDAPHPPILCDWKTGNAKDKDAPDIYDEAKAQVAAYVSLWNINNIDKWIKKAYIVSLAKDKVAYKIYSMEEEEIDGWFNEVFLPALKIFNFQKQQKQIEKERKKDARNGHEPREKAEDQKIDA